jgi:hypothetical protein
MTKEQAIRSYRVVVTGLAAQQIYTHCHDEGVSKGIFTHDLKMSSNNLVSKLETKFKHLYTTLGQVNGGDEYVRALATMDETLAELSGLPLEFWYAITMAIRNVKKAIAEAEANGTPIPDGTDVLISGEGEE